MTRTEELSIRTVPGEDGLLHLVLDAGKGNVLDRKVIAELREILAGWREDPHRRCLLIDHAGAHFSYGASVPDHVPGAVEVMLPELHALARELLALEVPVLCAVRGLCLGGGLELALLADRVFASPTARLGQPEVSLAVFAPIGSALLPRVVGPRHAADLLLTGRTVGAEEARTIGLVAEIADDPALAARAWVREHLVGKSAAALRHATFAARCAWLPSFLEDLERLERAYLLELMATHDAVEGITAFLEKRDPRWEDR